MIWQLALQPDPIRGSVPQILRPVEFAPVEIIIEDQIRYDELGLIYRGSLRFVSNIRNTLNIENPKVSIDTTGLVYKGWSGASLSPGHEYGYFADPDLYRQEQYAMNHNLSKKRRVHHKKIEKPGYIPAKLFVAPKKDFQLPLL